MASIVGNSVANARFGGEPAAPVQVPRGRRYPALAVLLTGKSAGYHPVVERFLDYLGRDNPTLDLLWALPDRHGEWSAACMVVQCAGRTGMMFLSPSNTSAGLDRWPSLISHVVHQMRPERIKVLQSLLDPDQEAEAQAYQNAGFARLATLVYMDRPLEARDRPAVAELPDGLGVQHWTGGNQELFESAILSSYLETLDCPGLCGMRKIEDVIAGHRATGEFAPELWHVAVHEGQGVAVMLLNLLPHQQSIELVYLGIAPAWRGKGLGKALLQRGMIAGLAHRCRSMVCAVDDKNTPALALYRGIGFLPTARKVALVREIGGGKP